METGVKSKEVDGVVRHCAYCLQLCGSPAKLCGGCKKRAYCSKECQRADWYVKGNGQRHVNWCRRHEYGEEDVDWEVVPIPNKGLGIRAKQLIPAGMKIIVEPSYSSPKSHPGIKDLGPEDVTLEKKFNCNFFNGHNVNSGRPITIALRHARVNHSCQPNADTIYDETARVAILFAQKDIQPGEEISICYYSPIFSLLSDPSKMPGVHPDWNIEEQFNFIKNAALTKSGITCPSDCQSYDPATQALVQEGRQIHAKIIELQSQRKIGEALEAGEKLLDIQRRLDVSWWHLGFVYFTLFRVAVQLWETLPRAKEYIRSAVDR